MKHKLNDVAKRWVKALRSGDYEQGAESLANVEENGITYCCLGVLCELAVKEGIIRSKKNKSSIRYGGPTDGKTDLLPDKVVRWAGLKNNDGDRHKPDTHTLAELNDDYAWSFKKIAKYIEENAKELFVE